MAAENPEIGVPNWLTYFHITKQKKVRDIRGKGIIVSTGIAAGGSSADSGEAYMYSEQDKERIFLWSHIYYADKFVDETKWEEYALIIVKVPTDFAAKNIKSFNGSETTYICTATIPLAYLYYKKDINDPVIKLTEWGKFNMALDRSDTRIWTGEGARDMEEDPIF